MESDRHLYDSLAANRAEFTHQADSFARSDLLGAPEQIRPLLAMAQLTPGDRVLDVGCGTGFLLVEAAKQAGQAVGIDLTAAMLHQARAAITRAGLTNVILRESYAEAIPFANERFDVAMTRLLLHHSESPGRILGEMHRVCRSEGRVVVCDICSADDPSQADLHNRIERLRDPSHYRYGPAGELVRLVEQSGFKVTNTYQWQTRRHFGEWLDLASVRAEVRPALAALLRAVIPGDAAGIGAQQTGEGELIFYHNWMAVAGVKRSPLIH